MGIAEELLKITKRPNARVRLCSYTGSPSVDPSGTWYTLQAPVLEAIAIDHNFDQTCQTCTISFVGSTGIPSIKPMDKVIVEQGYGGYYIQTFEGFVDKIGKSRPSYKQVIQCRDILKLAVNDYLLDEFILSSSPGTNYKSETFRQGENIVSYFLTNAGIPLSRQALGTTDTTFARYSDAAFQYLSAIEAISQITAYLGWRLWVDSSGMVRFAYVRPVPSTGYFRLFKEATAGGTDGNIIDIRYAKDDESLRNYIKVEGYDSDITDTDYADSSYVPNPPQYRRAAINNSLIDIQDMAETVAARILADLNRLTEAIEIDIEGDPRLQIGMTVGVTDSYSGNSSSNYFIYGLRSQQDSRGYYQTLTLVGGSASDYAAAQAPVASFSWKIETEYWEGQNHFIVMVDGSESYDPDGSISTYSWSDGINTETGVRTRFIYDDPLTSARTIQITLTVTDNDANTGSIMRTIEISNDNPNILTRVLYLATSTEVQVSQDGGTTWKVATLA